MSENEETSGNEPKPIIARNILPAVAEDLTRGDEALIYFCLGFTAGKGIISVYRSYEVKDRLMAALDQWRK